MAPFLILMLLSLIVILLVMVIILGTMVVRDDKSSERDDERPFWKIVRYNKDGSFDCVWSSGIYDKRVADKKCARLNNPGEGNEYLYGKYVVEKH
mgnify:CR=1 FL=1